MIIDIVDLCKREVSKKVDMYRTVYAKTSFFRNKKTKQTIFFGSVVERSVAERNGAANTFRDGFDRNAFCTVLRGASPVPHSVKGNIRTNSRRAQTQAGAPLDDAKHNATKTCGHLLSQSREKGA